MGLILCCPRERVSKSLYVMQLFILAGMVYYFFHGRHEKNSEDNLGTLGVPKHLGETLRPVLGLADKCYPVTQPSQRTAKVAGPEVTALEDPEDPVDFVGKEGLHLASEENKYKQKAKVCGEESLMDRELSWVARLLRGLWVDWFSAPNLPKTQNH